MRTGIAEILTNENVKVVLQRPLPQPIVLDDEMTGMLTGIVVSTAAA